jgi:hypothetical protein
MDAVGRRPGSKLGSEQVPKAVVGRAFTVVKARPCARLSDPGRIPVDPHGSVEARLPPARRGGQPGGPVGI